MESTAKATTVVVLEATLEAATTASTIKEATRLHRDLIILVLATSRGLIPITLLLTVHRPSPAITVVYRLTTTSAHRRPTVVSEEEEDTARLHRPTTRTRRTRHLLMAALLTVHRRHPTNSSRAATDQQAAATTTRLVLMAAALTNSTANLTATRATTKSQSQIVVSC